ncbi:MAG TPA: NUDIX hydrolase [Polyangiaceae bacterium]|jgi:ADP-ribose pyrophosphatase YjhB (NUDIX family)|nr:NUDIX hydrolase [Polyangiaceae bacterium]
MDWLEVVQALQRIAQAGLTYTEGPYDRERYSELMKIAAEITAGSLGGPVTAALDVLSTEVGYATPKVDVRAVVPKDGKLLFVRESEDGLWSLPGGWADIGSTPAEMAAREVLEETGYVVTVKKLLALLDKSKHEHPRELFWVYKAVFLCELVSGEPRTSHETTEIAFFGKDELPPLSDKRITRGQVLRMFEHVAHPELTTDFD